MAPNSPSSRWRSKLGEFLGEARMLTLALKASVRKILVFLAVVSVLVLQACPNCGAQGHDPDARHCKYCGGSLETGPLQG